MKIIIAILLFGTFLMCANTTWSAKYNATSIESFADSSFEHFVDSAASGEQFSDEQVRAFISRQWIDSADEGRTFSGSDFLPKHSEKYLMIMYRASEYGVCSLDILATYTPDGKQIDNILAGKVCDQDFSNPEMLYSEFELFEDSLIEVREVTERAKLPAPGSLSEGTDADPTDSYDEDADYEIESVQYDHYAVEPSGMFRQIFDTNIYEEGEKHCPVSVRILADSNLSALTKEEMVGLKNELLARKGYKFPDASTERAFRKFRWYKPRFASVGELGLNPVEKMNLRKIDKALAK